MAEEKDGKTCLKKVDISVIILEKIYFTAKQHWRQRIFLKNKGFNSGGFISPDFILKYGLEDFPGGTVDKNLPAIAGDMGLIPGLGRSHMARAVQPVCQLLSP